MRASWSGALQAALLVVPVKTYGATKEHDTRFRNLCPCHHQPIKMPKVCAVTGQVPPGTLLRDCRIMVPGREAVVTDLEVRYTTPSVLADGSRVNRSGVRFLQKTDELEALIKVFVIDLEQKAKE